MQYLPSPPHFPNPLPLLPDPPTIQSVNPSSHSILSQSKRKFSHPSRVSPTLSRNQRQLYVDQMMFRHRRTCGFLTYAGVSSSSHLGCILNLQYLAQSIPAAFTSAHVGSDSYNVAFMCAFLPALPGPPREVMHVYMR